MLYICYLAHLSTTILWFPTWSEWSKVCLTVQGSRVRIPPVRGFDPGSDHRGCCEFRSDNDVYMSTYTPYYEYYVMELWGVVNGRLTVVQP